MAEIHGTLACLATSDSESIIDLRDYDIKGYVPSKSQQNLMELHRQIGRLSLSVTHMKHCV